MKVMLLLVLHLLDAHTIKANIGSMHTQNKADLLATFCSGIADLSTGQIMSCTQTAGLLQPERCIGNS